MSAEGLKRNRDLASGECLPFVILSEAEFPLCHPERSAQRGVEGSRKVPAFNLTAYVVGGGGVDRDASFVVVTSICSHGVAVYPLRKITRQAKAAV